jgi:hypothetical protein
MVYRATLVLSFVFAAPYRTIGLCRYFGPSEFIGHAGRSRVFVAQSNTALLSVNTPSSYIVGKPEIVVCKRNLPKGGTVPVAREQTRYVGPPTFHLLAVPR